MGTALKLPRTRFGASLSVTTKKPKAKKQYPFLVKLIGQFLAQVQNKDVKSILGESGLAGQLKKMQAKRMLPAELPHHPASEGDSKKPCNGRSRKTVLAPGGELELETPRPNFQL